MMSPLRLSPLARCRSPLAGPIPPQGRPRVVQSPAPCPTHSPSRRMCLSPEQSQAIPKAVQNRLRLAAQGTPPPPPPDTQPLQGTAGVGANSQPLSLAHLERPGESSPSPLQWRLGSSHSLPESTQRERMPHITLGMTPSASSWGTTYGKQPFSV